MITQPKVYGIVIGVDSYETIGTLRGCVNDAMAFAGRLERVQNLGDIECLYVNDGYHKRLTPTRTHILAAVNRVVSRAHSDDYVFFYFAGHGLYHPEHGHCLLPIDFIQEETAETALRLDAIVSRLRASESNNIVLILDACRRLTGRREVDQEKPNFSEVALGLRGILTLAACMLGQWSMEFGRSDPKGLFTQALLDAWEPERLGLTFQELYVATRSRMDAVIRAEGLETDQQCSLGPEPIEKAYLLVPQWISSPPPDENALTIEFPLENTKASTVRECRGRFSGEVSAWRKSSIWVNLLDLNGNRYLQQPEVTFMDDERWFQDNICPGSDIVALEVLWVNDFGRKVFQQMILSHSFGAFRVVPEGTVKLGRVKLA